MEVFAPGYQPREVQFAIVEQNPTLLNITLFAESPLLRPEISNNLESTFVDEDLKDRLDLGDNEDALEDNDDEEAQDEDDDKIFGIIPNPLAKIQKDIQTNVDSFFSNIPLIG